jgi:hypothetical protein
MSVVNLKKLGSGGYQPIYDRHDFPREEDRVCFHCQESVNDVFVFWCGQTNLVFHPVCAQKLGNALRRDAIEVLCGRDVAQCWYQTKI